MSAHSKIQDGLLASVREGVLRLAFHPRGTVRCAGTPMFRSQLARDLGCLLDLDADVSSWTCLPMALVEGKNIHVPDFLVLRAQGSFLCEAVSSASWRPPPWAEAAGQEIGYPYETWSLEQIASGFRLQNARDLLHYARWHCPLGDRVR